MTYKPYSPISWDVHYRCRDKGLKSSECVNWGCVITIYCEYENDSKVQLKKYQNDGVIGVHDGYSLSHHLECSTNYF